jgi:hypothetical protein
VHEERLQSRLDLWRAAVTRRGGADPADLAADESRLRSHVDGLTATGLDADEAFLIALKRVSECAAASADTAASPLQAATREFARDYARDLLAGSDAAEKAAVPATEPVRGATADLWPMLLCALGAALAIKVPALFCYGLSGDGEQVYVLNLSLFVLPFLSAYFAWKRRTPRGYLFAGAGAFAAAAVFANAYPFASDGATLVLTAIHLPVVLWLVMGVVRAGADWRSNTGRMDFTRFTGEWFVMFVLIGLGGGVLIAITVGVFEAIGLDAAPVVEEWIAPCGAMAAVIVAAWLVDTGRKLGVAPMLARVFTPLFAVLLVAVLAGVLVSGGSIDVEREALILFDVLLVVVLALLLYAFSARDPAAQPALFDRIQLALVACALAVDLFALASIAVRLGQFGFSANKTAALGLNLILLVNLAWSAWLQVGFLRSRREFAQVEHWQMRYLPVYAAWAAFVVVAFPPLFGFA